MGGKAVDQLPEGAGYEEMLAAVESVVAELGKAFEHLETCTAVVESGWLGSAEKKAVGEALKGLPVGTSRVELERARAAALARLRSPTSR